MPWEKPSPATYWLCQYQEQLQCMAYGSLIVQTHFYDWPRFVLADYLPGSTILSIYYTCTCGIVYVDELSGSFWQVTDEEYPCRLCLTNRVETHFLNFEFDLTNMCTTKTCKRTTCTFTSFWYTPPPPKKKKKKKKKRNWCQILHVSSLISILIASDRYKTLNSCTFLSPELELSAKY